MIVLGANSDISKAFVEKILEKEPQLVKHLFLFTSNINAIETFKNHIEVKYQVPTKIIVFNLLENKIFDFSSLDFELVFCASGYLGNTEKGVISDANDIQKIISINYANLIQNINAIAQQLEKKEKGVIIGLSSVAGDRGRQSNFIYGSAKAGFTAYLSGLRNYLQKKGVHVITIKPGFMNTKMTANLELPKPLTINPDIAANLIYKAYKKRKNVVYISGIWRYIMLIIKLIPEFIFKKLSL